MAQELLQVATRTISEQLAKAVGEQWQENSFVPLHPNSSHDDDDDDSSPRQVAGQLLLFSCFCGRLNGSRHLFPKLENLIVLLLPTGFFSEFF